MIWNCGHASLSHHHAHSLVCHLNNIYAGGEAYVGGAGGESAGERLLTRCGVYVKHGVVGCFNKS